MQSDTTVRSWKRGKGEEKIGKTQLRKRLKRTANWTNKTDKLAEGKKMESFYGVKPQKYLIPAIKLFNFLMLCLPV